MTQPRLSFEIQRQYFQAELDRNNMLAVLKSPEGLEALADAIHAMRIWIADTIDTSELKRLLNAENEMRAASAQPLPPSLAP